MTGPAEYPSGDESSASSPSLSQDPQSLHALAPFPTSNLFLMGSHEWAASLRERVARQGAELCRMNSWKRSSVYDVTVPIFCLESSLGLCTPHRFAV